MRLHAAIAALALLAAGCATSYQARGLVLRVDPAAATLTVSHEAIPGLMDAMAMRFVVRDTRRLGELRPGDRIAFRLRVDDRETRIDRLRLLSAAASDSGLVMSPSAPALVTPGDPVPDFTLVDQDGAPLSLSSLRGRVVAVTFVYSRCPLPDYCPRMVDNLRSVRERFADRLGRDLVLLTISFDPRYDTPEVLRKYAAFNKAGGPGWRFLTGSEAEIQRVCAAFGVEYWPDQGLFTHTLATALIDRDGRLAASVEGKDVTGRQIADLVGTVLDPDYE